EVDGDVAEAQLLEAPRDRLGQALLEETWHVVLRQLDPSDVAMVADPHLSIAEVLEELLGTVDLDQFLRAYALPIGHAGGQARHSGLIPRGEAQLARQGPNILLRHVGFEQRTPHAMLARGSRAGTEVAHVVGVEA